MGNRTSNTSASNASNVQPTTEQLAQVIANVNKCAASHDTKQRGVRGRVAIVTSDESTESILSAYVVLADKAGTIQRFTVGGDQVITFHSPAKDSAKHLYRLLRFASDASGFQVTLLNPNSLTVSKSVKVYADRDTEPTSKASIIGTRYLTSQGMTLEVASTRDAYLASLILALGKASGQNLTELYAALRATQFGVSDIVNSSKNGLKGLAYAYRERSEKGGDLPSKLSLVIRETEIETEQLPEVEN